MIKGYSWLLTVLLAVAAPVLADEVKGKIKSINADKSEFVLTDKDGKDWTFKMDDNAKIRLNDKDSKLNDLKEGDEIKVTYDKKGDQLIAKEIHCERK